MPFKKDGTRKKSFKRNPYTNSPVGDISGDKVYGPATAVIAAGKKFKSGKKIKKYHWHRWSFYDETRF